MSDWAASRYGLADATSLSASASASTSLMFVRSWADERIKSLMYAAVSLPSREPDVDRTLVLQRSLSGRSGSLQVNLPKPSAAVRLLKRPTCPSGIVQRSTCPWTEALVHGSSGPFKRAFDIYSNLLFVLLPLLFFAAGVLDFAGTSGMLRGFLLKSPSTAPFHRDSGLLGEVPRAALRGLGFVVAVGSGRRGRPACTLTLVAPVGESGAFLMRFCTLSKPASRNVFRPRSAVSADEPYQVGTCRVGSSSRASRGGRIGASRSRPCPASRATLRSRTCWSTDELVHVAVCPGDGSSVPLGRSRVTVMFVCGRRGSGRSAGVRRGGSRSWWQRSRRNCLTRSSWCRSPGPKRRVAGWAPPVVVFAATDDGVEAQSTRRPCKSPLLMSSASGPDRLPNLRLGFWMRHFGTGARYA